MTFTAGTKVFYVGGDYCTSIPVNSVGHVIDVDEFGEGAYEDSTLVRFAKIEFPDGVTYEDITQDILTNCLYETE